MPDSISHLQEESEPRDSRLPSINDYQYIFEHSPTAQVIVDQNMNILEANGQFIYIIGYPHERVIKMKITDFRSQGLVKYLKDSGQTIADAITKKTVTHGDSTLDSPSGIHVVQRTNIPLFDDHGNVRYVYVSYNIITKIIKNQEYMAHEIAELQKIYAIGAAGDLTQRYHLTEPDEDTRETYDQIVALRDSVRGIINALQINIKDVNRRMQEMVDNSVDASRSIDDASLGLGQIARNTGVVSEKAQHATNNINDMARAMQDMSATVEEVTSSMESVATQAKAANEAADKGASFVENVNKGMTDIKASTENVDNVVREIVNQMSDIGKIITLIRDLANQTNLLSLNAAIEAARAGEHGRGFAVVASEVKALAQESRSSAERIEEMITHLNMASKKAIDAMEISKTLVSKGLLAASEAQTAFQTIQSASETVARNASEVAAATEEQAATVEEMTASTQEIANLIEQTAKESTDAAAATEESSAAIDEITKMIKNVSNVANDALLANQKFKV